MEDRDFKPLIQQLLKESKKKPEFANTEDRIMHNYVNRVGTFSKSNRTGKKLPPSVILGALRRQSAATSSYTRKDGGERQ